MDDNGDVQCPRGSWTGGMGGLSKNYNRWSVADSRQLHGRAEQADTKTGWA